MNLLYYIIGVNVTLLIHKLLLKRIICLIIFLSITLQTNLSKNWEHGGIFCRKGADDVHQNFKECSIFKGMIFSGENSGKICALQWQCNK